MLHIILYGTEDPGNVGAIARLMGNFNQSHLLFVEPKCNPLDITAIKRAKHAKHIILNAPLVTTQVLDQFDVLIGTTARTGTKDNIKRHTIDLRDCIEKVKPLEPNQHIGLLFGPEGTGLPNELIERCDILAHIPTHHSYPVLNLSHAVGLCLYEFSKPHKHNTLTITQKRKEELLHTIDIVLKKLDLKTEHMYKNQLLLWKRILGKSLLTEREADMLFGVFKTIEKKL